MVHMLLTKLHDKTRSLSSKGLLYVKQLYLRHFVQIALSSGNLKLPYATKDVDSIP